VCFNFLALEIKIKSRQTVNNYGCKLNKQESKAKLPLFKATWFLLVIRRSDMTIKPKRGEKKISCLDYLSEQRKGDSRRMFLWIWTLQIAALVLFKVTDLFFLKHIPSFVTFIWAITPALHLLAPWSLVWRFQQARRITKYPWQKTGLLCPGRWLLFGLQASAGCTMKSEMQGRHRPSQMNQHK